MNDAPADFLEFATSSSPRLLRTACLLTGDWHLAEDLVQETLAKMYRSWRRIKRAESAHAYASAALVRAFLSHRRRRSSTERPSEALPDRIADRADDVELRLTLLDGLAQLSARDRAVLVLRYWEDCSVEQTAQVLSLSDNAVRVRSLRALQRLRALLGDQLADIAR